MRDAVIVERPALQVTTAKTSYDANQLSLVTHEGRWCLSFVSSGGMVVVPVSEVLSIQFYQRGAQWCVSCDGRLSAWPINDPSYHRTVPVED